MKAEAAPDDSERLGSASMEREAGEPFAAAGTRIGGRYQVVAVLGRGGMGVVYRVHDASSQQTLALKQLLTRHDGGNNQQAISLFEREFYTLAQLAHPRVIQVYDYGVDPHGPFYTMELLGGGDLKELAPLDYRRACALMLDVCSSLALLHSRRLVHRDISPRNVRCTHDGHAKLIDFGAMVTMGPCAHTVGTPAFIAPEVLHHLSLDARTDLFSLGATLYYTLTARAPFVVRELSELREAWSRELVPVSQLIPHVPPALDALCAALLRIDPAQRPRNAFEVMHRLEAIAGLEHDEPIDVSAAYLATPILVGRGATLRGFRQQMKRAQHGLGSALLFDGVPGIGRSRVLDACVLEAKTLGVTVLRVDASAADEAPFAGGRRLAEQLLQALPDAARTAAVSAGAADLLFADADRAPKLRALSELAIEGQALQTALTRWIVRACETHALLIAVDDVRRLDEASIALLAGICLEASGQRLLIAITSETGVEQRGSQALALLARQCSRSTLVALTRAETSELFNSVFGDVPHIALLSDRLHTISGGSPRAALALAQHLVDTGRIRYEGGQWTLPAELEPRDLPASANEAFAARIAALPELARRLAETQALSGRSALCREDFALLAPDASGSQLDAAISALVTHEVLRSEGPWYRLAHHVFAETLVAQLDELRRSERHLALFGLFVRDSATHPYVLVRHLIGAGRNEQALDLLAKNAERIERGDAASALRADPRSTLERALELATQLNRPPREAHDLRHRLCLLAVLTDAELHLRVGPAWLAQLVMDSGLADYRAQDERLEPSERLKRALQAAATRYAQTPETERVYRVDEAIKNLVVYVVTALVVSHRVADMRMKRELGELLEPFSALSPALYAIHQNAVADYEANCLARTKRGLLRWSEVYERLSHVQGNDLQYVDEIRKAVAHALASIEARIGLPNVSRWVEVLDHDPVHCVNAMYLRHMAALMQGDVAGAATLHRQAELLAVQASGRQLYDTNWRVELLVTLTARDLTGLKRVIDGIEPLAARYAGWVPYRHLAEGHFQLLRGDFAAARAAFERCLAIASPDHDDPPPCLDIWALAASGLIDAMTELGDATAAVEYGERALAICHALQIDIMWHWIARSLCLSEASIGRLARATERVEALIVEQRALGITGLSLAASYEARARIAIRARCAADASRYTALAVGERHGHATTLGAHFAQLLGEARAAGIDITLAPSGFEASVLGTRRAVSVNPFTARVSAALAACPTPEARAAAALALLCELTGASEGHMYLVDDDAELSLAATRNTAPPDLAAIRFARGFFAQQLDEEGMTAGLTQATHMLSLPGAASWTDPRGKEHRLLLLTCKSDEDVVYAGLAVLAATQQPAKPETILCIAAVVEYLLSSADVKGVRPPAPG